MPSAEPTFSNRSGWLAPALLIGLAVTAFRVVLLSFNRTDLFVDEAQYWLWGQELALGYYSKPPLIAWVIRAATELGGSDAPFWVRLPAPLFHLAGGLLLGALTAPRYGRAVAIWVVASYLSLPMVAAGSLLISTDTIMVPFLVLGLIAWLRALGQGGSVPWAALAGFCVGIGFLAKYAAVYFVLCAALSALILPQARPGWRSALAGLLAFLVAISPNIWWNLQNGFSTVEHTLDNADWVRDPGSRVGLNLGGLAEFLGAQLFVFGPVLFPALVWFGATWRRRDDRARFLLLFCLPVLAIVSLQALIDRAYPNWAAAAYLTGTIAIVAWLHGEARGWLRASLAVNLVIAILLPVATVIGTGWRAGPGGPLLLERYVGRTEMSAAILAAARESGAKAIVSDDRDILADLMYQTRDGGIPINALPQEGRPRNHYALKYTLPSDSTGDVLLVTNRDHRPGECQGPLVGTLQWADGAYSDKVRNMFLLPAPCLALGG
ncbi:glycosyltransferase family 39 protein [Tropicimonas sp. IMCC34043]|uniref:ArnT family glycosyltransferase n=1 Tax=Tropicimonas sp. IMCC34043 TaxID=2248760 RepID=UPI000E279E9F|nr:glycosyltransferase family 39 protein [Tropicimonas sp. IMCC34043]